MSVRIEKMPYDRLEKGDGTYLEVLNEDGSIKDSEFIEKWMAR